MTDRSAFSSAEPVAAPALVLAGTLDTKSGEIGFVKGELERLGRSVIVIDCGILGRPGMAADIPREAVASAVGASIDQLRRMQDREVAIPTMAAGLQAILQGLLDQGRIAGFLAIGGGTNAAFAAAAFKLLPFGMPKVLVSTVACGNTRPFVGIKDVVLFHSVVDILGLNDFLRGVLRQAAAALDAMVAIVPPARNAASATRRIAVTAYGATTAAATLAVDALSARGFEVLTFHARGVGGEAMETLIRAGEIDAVLDLTTTEIADEVVGGICSAGPERLTAAGQAGIPQVVLPGAIDMVNFGPPATVPERFRDRKLVRHTPNATLMRTTAAENMRIGAIMAEHLNEARGPTAVILPLRGFSAYDREGGAFFDPDADAAFRKALKDRLAGEVRLVEIDAHVNDEVTVETALGLLEGMLDAQEQEMS